MASRGKKRTRTAAQLKTHIDRIQRAIDAYRRRNRGLQVAAITPRQIEKKLRRTNSPILTFHGWNAQPANGRIHIDLGVDNPDPTAATDRYGLVWVGTGYADPVVGTYLLNVDTRFPRLVEPNVASGGNAFGLTLAAGTSTTLHFDLTVPSRIPPTNYIVNVALMQLPPFDDPLLLDRTLLVFNVP
jgi:hypothetical protein